MPNFLNLTLDIEDSNEPETWRSIVQQRCPALFSLVSKDKHINASKLQRFMETVPLQLDHIPDKPNEALEHICQALWQFYVKTVHRLPDEKELTRAHNKSIEDEVRFVGSLLFHNSSPVPHYSLDDLKFLYNIEKMSDADESSHGNLFRITKKRGDMVLKVTRNSRGVKSSFIQGVDTMMFLQKEKPLLREFFIGVYDNRFDQSQQVVYTLVEAMDQSMQSFMTSVQKLKKNKASNKRFWQSLELMFIHALYGLRELQKMGYAHNDVKLSNLGIKVDSMGTHVKWLDFQSLGSFNEEPKSYTEKNRDFMGYAHLHDRPSAKFMDSFSFGIMIYKVLYGVHPGKGSASDWACQYTTKDSVVHTNLQKLRDDHRMPYLGKIAYHFTINQWFHKSVKRWNLEDAVKYLSQPGRPLHDYLNMLQIPKNLTKSGFFYAEKIQQ